MPRKVWLSRRTTGELASFKQRSTKLLSAKKWFGRVQLPRGRLVPPGFPVLDSVRIDAEPLRQLPLRQTLRPASRDQPFGECCGQRRGIVAEEPDDRRHVMDRRLGCVAFPVRNGQRTHPNQLGNLRLKEAKVQPAGADMVA